MKLILIFYPLELCSFSLVYIIRAWKHISVGFYLFLSSFSHGDCVYSVVFNLSYQVVDLNINNHASPSELCELLGNSWVYGTHLCVVLSRNGENHIWSTLCCVCPGRHTQEWGLCLHPALVWEDPQGCGFVVSAELYHSWLPDRLLIPILASLLRTAGDGVNRAWIPKTCQKWDLNSQPFKS